MGPRDRAKILVVDDLPGQRLAIEAALAELNEEIVSVGSGLEALRYLLDNDVAVILLDVNMPEMDGFEIASLIRQRPRSHHTPIIFLTADTNEMLALRGYSLGAVDYIFNPFLPDVLRAKVRVLVQMKRAAEQQILLSREQAARAAAEEESRGLRFLAEASGILTRSLDTAALVGDLLVLFVPTVADFAAIVFIDEEGKALDPIWRQAARGRLSRQPLVEAGVAGVEELVEKVAASGDVQIRRAAEGSLEVIGLPLVARDRTYAVLALASRATSRDLGVSVDLLRDVANRAAIALDNSRLYRAIHERDRQKDEFLAMLSHELRNPLGAITTAVKLLEMVPPSDPRASRAREVIARQSGHLSRMVDDLLDVARLTAGRVALDLKPVDAAETMQQAIEALRLSGMLDRHHVDVSVESVAVDGDQARLEQIVTNLLVNAIKYTDPGGRVEVEVREEDGEAVIRVRDSGIGISADMLPRLFDLFAQERQTLDRARGGLGIGLALVRRLVELHGGRVAAHSDGPGKGSVFTIRLPRLQRATAAARNHHPSGCRPGPLRVLVVEDNQDVRDMLRTFLELAGHEVWEAENGLEALGLAARTNAQIALIDLGLPGLDGLELGSRIRATDYGQGMVLVAVTGYGQASDRQRTTQAGFDLHLTKPVDVERLDEILALAARRTASSTGLKPDDV